MRPPITVLALLLVPSVASAQQPAQANVPSGGFVPDSATAVRIAVAVWIPLYGERAIMAQQPFVARANDGVWTVTGTSSRTTAPLIVVDGRVLTEEAGAATPVAKIARRDARILEVNARRVHVNVW